MGKFWVFLLFLVSATAHAVPFEYPGLEVKVHHPSTVLSGRILRTRYGGLYLRLHGNGTLSGSGYEVDLSTLYPIDAKYEPALHTLMDIRQHKFYAELSAPCPYIKDRPLINSHGLSHDYLSDRFHQKEHLAVYLENKPDLKGFYVSKVSIEFPFYLERVDIAPVRMTFPASVDVADLRSSYGVVRLNRDSGNKCMAGVYAQMVTGKGTEVFATAEARLQVVGLGRVIPIEPPNEGFYNPGFLSQVDALNAENQEARLPLIIVSSEKGRTPPPEIQQESILAVSSDAKTVETLGLALPMPRLLVTKRIANALLETLRGCARALISPWMSESDAD